MVASTATAAPSSAGLSTLVFSSNNIIRRNSSTPSLSFKPLGLGLRLPTDRFALKSSFYNAGSPVSLPSQDSGSNRIFMKTATTGAYICRDCGYIYNERKPFEKLPDDFRCPVCYAPKRRFRPYDLPVAKNVNQLDVRKARKEQLKSEDNISKALPVAIVVGLGALVGVYFYLNSQF